MTAVSRLDRRPCPCLRSDRRRAPASTAAENFSRIISRAWRIVTRSAGIDRSLGLPKARPKQASGNPPSLHENTPGGIISLWWAASYRNDGRHHSVMVGDIISFWWAASRKSAG